MVTATGSCFVDFPPSGSTVQLGEEFKVAGWAFDQASGSVPQKVDVQFVHSDRTKAFVLTAARGTQRPDVAAALKVPAAGNSGFDALAKLDSLPPGRYATQVIQRDSQGMIICAPNHWLTLAPSKTSSSAR